MALDKTRNFLRSKRKELALLAVSTGLSFGVLSSAYKYLTKDMVSMKRYRDMCKSAQEGTLEDNFSESSMKNDCLINGLKNQVIRVPKNPRRTYEFVPNALVVDKVLNKFNCWGYRDYDYPEKKPENTFRIGMFGDSFTAGWGISDNFQSYSKILEVIVSQVPDLSKQYQFLNFGSPGYNSLAEVSLFQEEALRLDLDAAVLQFFEDDGGYATGQVDSDTYSEEAAKSLFRVMKGDNPEFWNFFDELLKRMKKIAVPRSMDLYFLSHCDPGYLKSGKRSPKNIRAVEIARNNDFGIIDVWDSLRESVMLYGQKDSCENLVNLSEDDIAFLRVAPLNSHPSILSNEMVALYILKHVLPSIPEEDRDKIRGFYFNGGYRRHFQSYDARRMLPSLPKRHLDEINGSMKERLEDYFKAVSN